MDYYALDLSLDELKRTFSEINPEGFAYVGLHGLHGTYDDGLVWLQNAENRTRPTVVLSIGSSIGNFSRSTAPEFLAGFAKSLSPGDLMIIGLDACQDPDRVFKAYNDSEGVTHQFYENGLVHANRVLGFDAFKADEWEIVTAYDVPGGRHHAYYSPKVDVVINGRAIGKGEKLHFEESVKYNRQQRDVLWREAALIAQAEFGNDADTYRACLRHRLCSPYVPITYTCSPLTHSSLTCTHSLSLSLSLPSLPPPSLPLSLSHHAHRVPARSPSAVAFCPSASHRSCPICRPSRSAVQGLPDSLDHLGYHHQDHDPS